MKVESNGGLSLLFLIFLVLKLTHVINWSWWWIFAPIWIPVAIVAILFILAVILR